MKPHGKLWTVVLAGGDGTRLAPLSRDNRGNHVPKQFCSLNGNEPLLHVAMRRAWGVSPRERTCIVVAEKHRPHWEDKLHGIDVKNVIVQPGSCGTANGILLATLSVTLRDPDARIIFLPADHYVRDEARLGASLKKAASALARRQNGIVLVGIEPEGADCELGYIVPGAARDDGSLSVARFVEKPDSLLARDLIAQGAVWNSFIFAATGVTLFNILRRYMPKVVDAMSSALHTEALLKKATHMLSDLYATLPTIDFSKIILQGSESLLTLVKAPPCGWTDLGTPKRVAGIINDLCPVNFATEQHGMIAAHATVDLAEQYQKLGQRM